MRVHFHTRTKKFADVADAYAYRSTDLTTSASPKNNKIKIRDGPHIAAFFDRIWQYSAYTENW